MRVVRQSTMMLPLTRQLRHPGARLNPKVNDQPVAAIDPDLIFFEAGRHNFQLFGLLAQILRQQPDRFRQIA